MTQRSCPAGGYVDQDWCIFDAEFRTIDTKVVTDY